MQNQVPSQALFIRRSEDRGHADHGWLEARHSFSFADYYDPDHMSYRALRVINEDTIAPGKGFGTHPHKSMEIFTFIKEGSLRHEDSMGNGREIQAGEFQYMSAGSGVLHSEVNPSASTETKLLQIWLTPAQPGGEPRYQDFQVSTLDRQDGLALLASPDGREGSIAIRQNAEVLHGSLRSAQAITLPVITGRPFTWLQLIKGELTLGDESLAAGDAAAIDHTALAFTAKSDAEFLLFRLS
jgi:redox-sensitive bicupin YhaK (pirin superfamily)